MKHFNFMQIWKVTRYILIALFSVLIGIMIYGIVFLGIWHLIIMLIIHSSLLVMVIVSKGDEEETN